MSETATAWICPKCGHFTVRSTTPERVPSHDCGIAGGVVEFVPYVDSAQALQIRNGIDSTSAGTNARRRNSMIRESTIKRGVVERPMLGIPQLAERLGTTERFIRRLVCERRIPFHKVGKYVRFDQDDVDEWVALRRVEACR